MRLAQILRALAPEVERPRSIYLHLPFCSSKCGYCDFHSLPLGAGPLAALYVERLLSRLSECIEVLGVPPETLYLGGGTPTVLDEALFARLVSGIGKAAGAGLLEWTCEANPESLSQAKLEAAARAGVTRLSLGIQSMDPEELRALGRRAGPEDNGRALALAAASGLAVSVDLICSIPAPAGRPRRRAALQESLEAVLAAGAGHVSLYELVVEEATPLAGALERGDLSPPDPDEVFEERKAAERRLARANLERYEVSNFARPGEECLHNAAYWDLRSYLGLGSGAVSTLVSPGPAFDPREAGTASLRLSEGRDLDSWTAGPDASLSVERLGIKDSAFEAVMMGLRTRKGLDSARFASRFGLRPEELLGRTMERWEGRIGLDGAGNLAPSDDGLDLLNRILVDALEDVERRWEA